MFGDTITVIRYDPEGLKNLDYESPITKKVLATLINTTQVKQGDTQIVIPDKDLPGVISMLQDVLSELR